MSPSSLIRSVRFRARHHYGRPGASGDENRRAYGEYSEPHEHDFTVEVQVGGRLEPGNDFLVDLEALDALIQEILAPLEDADLNEAIPDVRDGRMLPSTESLARWLFALLDERIPPAVRLERVRVREDESLASEFRSPP